MGCDIHFYVEKKHPVGWLPVDPPDTGERNQDGTIHYDNLAYKSIGREPVDPPKWNIDRNYWLFSVLAGVRAYAPKPEPIALPRSLPSDVSSSVNAEYKSWDCDAHSASYLTLSELLKYEWLTPAVWTHCDFVDIVIPAMQAIGGPDEVRCVFWFDN